MTEKHYRVKIMETELMKPTENRSQRQKSSENVTPGKPLFRRSQDHRCFHNSIQGKVNFIRLGYPQGNRANWVY